MAANDGLSRPNSSSSLLSIIKQSGERNLLRNLLMVEAYLVHLEKGA